MTEPRRDFDAEMAYSGRMFGWSMGLLLLASVLFNIPSIFILGIARADRWRNLRIPIRCRAQDLLE